MGSYQQYPQYPQLIQIAETVENTAPIPWNRRYIQNIYTHTFRGIDGVYSVE